MAWTVHKRHRFVTFQELAVDSSNKLLDYNVDWAPAEGATGPPKATGVLEVVSIRVKFTAQTGAGTRKMGFVWYHGASPVIHGAYNFPSSHDAALGNTVRSVFTVERAGGASIAAVAAVGVGDSVEAQTVWGRMPPVYLGQDDSLRIWDEAAIAPTTDDMQVWVHCMLHNV